MKKFLFSYRQMIYGEEQHLCEELTAPDLEGAKELAQRTLIYRWKVWEWPLGKTPEETFRGFQNLQIVEAPEPYVFGPEDLEKAYLAVVELQRLQLAKEAEEREERDRAEYERLKKRFGV